MELIVRELMVRVFGHERDWEQSRMLKNFRQISSMAQTDLEQVWFLFSSFLFCYRSFLLPFSVLLYVSLRGFSKIVCMLMLGSGRNYLKPDSDSLSEFRLLRWQECDGEHAARGWGWELEWKLRLSHLP